MARRGATDSADLPVREIEVVDSRERAHPRVYEPLLRSAADATLDAIGGAHGHVAVTLVDADEMRRINQEQRGIDEPTDVLSFPVDERPPPGPRELGDVIVCPQQTDDPLRCTVHGVLHLLGHDHETDDGEMLALEDAIVSDLSG